MSDDITEDLTALASLAPLVGGIAVEALAFANSPQASKATAGEWSSDIVNRAERIHDLIMRPGATADMHAGPRGLDQEVANLCAILVAYTIDSRRRRTS